MNSFPSVDLPWPVPRSFDALLLLVQFVQEVFLSIFLPLIGLCGNRLVNTGVLRFLRSLRLYSLICLLISLWPLPACSLSWGLFALIPLSRVFSFRSDEEPAMTCS